LLLLGGLEAVVAETYPSRADVSRETALETPLNRKESALDELPGYVPFDEIREYQRRSSQVRLGHLDPP